MRIIRTIITSLLVAGCLFCFCDTGYSQGTNLGTIRGTVTDPNGAALPNATVQVTDLETGIQRDLTTNSEGNYEAANLKPGNYKVTITASGFKTSVANVVLNGSDTVRADVKVEIGDANATVDVATTEAGLIQTESSMVLDTLTNRQLQEVPRDSRDIYQFLYLNPNITQSAEGGGFKFIGSQSYGAAFTLDGQRSNGAIFGDPSASQPSLETIGELTVLSNNFSAEYAGIANVRVVTKRGGNEYHGSLFYNNKNSALAAWRIQDKIAQAAFTPTLNVPNFPKPFFNLNETGGSLSGPLPFGKKKKTFFLVSYERRWDLDTVLFSNRSMPTTAVQSGDFSGITNSNKPLVPAGIVLTPSEIANDTVGGLGLRFIRIPQRLLNPITTSIVNTYLPKVGSGAPFNPANGRLIDFEQNVGGLITRDLATARIDHDFSAKDKFYAVYNYSLRRGSRSPVAFPLPAFGFRRATRSNHTLSLSYTHIFSNNVINEARGGFNFQRLREKANQTTGEFLTEAGFNSDEVKAYANELGSFLPETFGQVSINVGTFFIGSAGIIPTGGRSVDRPTDQNLFTVGDTLTWIAGNHAIKTGFDVVRNSANDGFSANRNNPRGTIVYPASLSGFAQFLLGLPPSQVNYVQAIRPFLEVSNWEHGLFFQDDFRIHPRVTLNLGLRYELLTPFIEKNNLMVNFDPNGNNPNGNPGVFIVPTEDVFANIDPRYVDYGVITASEAGVGRGLVKSDRNNIAPRLGVAWRIADNSVLRGGYGVFYPTSAAQGIRDALSSSPFNQRKRKDRTFGFPGGVFVPAGTSSNRGFTPFSGGRIRPRQLDANAIPIDLQQPRIEQFNITFEHEFGWSTGVRVSYLGTRMHGLIAGFDLNAIPPSDVPFGNTIGDGVTLCDPTGANEDIPCDLSDADRARRPFPDPLGAFFDTYANLGRGRSHALQIEVNRRFAAGLTFNASYTLLDQKSSGVDAGNASLGGPLYNQFQPDEDLSPDSFVSRHRFISYGSYELPYGRDRQFGKSLSRWADAAVGGWQLTWQMFAKSGTGFTPFWTCGNCDPIFPGNTGSDAIDAVGDFNQTGYRPIVVGNPQNSSGLPPGFVFNGEAFTVPTLGADALNNPSIARRNSLIGPGTWGVNLGVGKNFKFSERVVLRLGADFNNVFNHPLRSPDNNEFANLGDFTVRVNSVTGKPEIDTITRNVDFGRADTSFTQEGIDNRRSVRIRLRLTF